MEEIKVTRYKCSYCSKVFESPYVCDWHEKETHLCPKCKHSYYVYGCERNCTLENKGKKCKFEESEKED